MESDPFLALCRSPRSSKPAAASDHAERAHSKFSASGASRWFACPGSVGLSEGLPDKSSDKAKEGTLAHEVVEKILLEQIKNDALTKCYAYSNVSRGMLAHAQGAADFMFGLHKKTPDSEIMVETRVYLDFLHPEAFGTFDGAVVEHFGTLHVFDFKYGTYPVSPKENLQMLFYAIGLAHRYQWNFERVRMWIIQPRVDNYEGPVFWEISIRELRAWVIEFQGAIDRVLKFPKMYVEGQYCYFCKAKSICPLKQEKKFDKANTIFGKVPLAIEEREF